MSRRHRRKAAPAATSDQPLCVLQHDEPRNTKPGLVVCGWHRGKTLELVKDLAIVHTELTERLTGGNSAPSNNDGGRLTGTDDGLSLNADVINARAHIARTLTRWALAAMKPHPLVIDVPVATPHVILVVDNRTPPRNHQPATVAVWIRERIDWFLARRSAPQFVAELESALARGRRWLKPDDLRTFTIGPCPEPDCDGTVITRMRLGDALFPPNAWCDKAPTDPETGEQIHVWPADEWRTLDRRIDRKTTTRGDR